MVVATVGLGPAWVQEDNVGEETCVVEFLPFLAIPKWVALGVKMCLEFASVFVVDVLLLDVSNLKVFPSFEEHLIDRCA